MSHGEKVVAGRNAICQIHGMNTEHVTNIIHNAAQLLSDPAKRCRHLYAQDADGMSISPQEAAACRFCLVGALERAGSNEVLDQIRTAVSGYLGCNWLLGVEWDNATDEQQEQMVQKLLVYPGAPVSGP